MSGPTIDLAVSDPLATPNPPPEPAVPKAMPKAAPPGIEQYPEPIGPEKPDGVEVLIPDLILDAGKDWSTGHKRTRLQRELDLEVIGKMLGKKKSHQEIAAWIGEHRPYHISRQQIEYDISALHKRWIAKHLVPLPEAKARELEFIEHLEDEAFAAWEASKLPSQSTRIEMEEAEVKDGKKMAVPVRTIRESKKNVGDPSFLAVLIKLSERRAKIRGLDAPVKADIKLEGKVEHTLDLERLRKAYRDKTIAEIGLVAKPLVLAQKNEVDR